MAQTRQETAFSEPSDLLARRMGFVPLPLGVAMGRVLTTTITPSMRAADIILLLCAYFILVTLRILNSLVILGKACDIISSQPKSATTEKPTSDSRSKTDRTDPSLSTAIFSNSAMSLNNVCLTDAVLQPPVKEMTRSSEDVVVLTKNVARADSAPVLAQ